MCAAPCALMIRSADCSSSVETRVHAADQGVNISAVIEAAMLSCKPCYHRLYFLLDAIHACFATAAAAAAQSDGTAATRGDGIA